MKVKASTIGEYLENIPIERKAVMQKLIAIINKNLPKGFTEQLNYGMPSWVVPHSIYADGYHCTPELPLPFLSIASQKHFIGLYHMGIYADTNLLDWFVKEYPKHTKKKLDMGKSCIRFKNIDDIPFDLITELCSKMNPKDWIKLYEKNLKR